MAVSNIVFPIPSTLARMKSFRFLILVGVAALASFGPLRLAAAGGLTVAPATETVYVKIDSPDLIAFHHYRLAEVNGTELILTTLKQTADDQARFAGYAGPVCVLDDDAKAPDGAPVLLLTWNGDAVSATLLRGGREKSLGIVSRTSLATHPNYLEMRKYLDKGLSEEQHDAHLRAKTQMNLYMALRILTRYQAKA
jgi:hypothetical protein